MMVRWYDQWEDAEIWCSTSSDCLGLFYIYSWFMTCPTIIIPEIDESKNRFTKVYQKKHFRGTEKHKKFDRGSRQQ